VMRNRQQIFMQAEARADQALADQAAAAERAATQERLRIAREMHDVVAHGMSVISVQAAAAQEIARTEPDRAIGLMKIVETTGRESLNEMRRMLGVLRNGATPDGENNITRAPQPSLDDLETIIEHCRGAGLETELTIAGEKRSLPAGLELTVYRIVQEALTNVLKHGGNAATANVEVAYTDTTIRIEVADTGRGVLSGLDGHSPGNGVIGMRERVELYEGEFSAGPQPGGGYLVTALLTTDATTKRPRVSSAETPSAETATTGIST
jgi:signal transduction histidine kinase